MNRVDKIFWGVVFLLHPFVIRLTSTMAGNSPVKYKLFTRIFFSDSIMRPGKDLIFYFFTALGVILLQKTYRQFTLVENGVILFIIIWAFLNLDDVLRPSSFYQIIFFIISIITFRLLYTKTFENFSHFIFNILIISGLLHSTWIFMEYLGINMHKIIPALLGGISTNPSKKLIVTGVLNNSNLSSAYLALCIPAFLRKNFNFLLPLIIGSLFFLNSLMGIFTGIAVIIYYLAVKQFKFNKTNLFYPLSTIIMISIMIFGVKGLDTHRVEIWQSALIYFNDFSIFGKGLGWFADNYHLIQKKFPYTIRQEHNEFLSLYFSFGFAGLILFGAIIWKTIKHNNALIGAGLFGVFINMFGNFTFHVTTLTLLGLFYLSESLKASKGYK